MSSQSSRAILIVLGLLLAGPAMAATKEERRVADAADVLNQFIRIPERAVPPALLARAYAVAVIPKVIKIGFGVGARRGKGIIVIRQHDKSWSNPAFITLTGGSVGWQVGAQSTDVILVFKTRKSVENIAGGKLTLGVDASIAAGPVGRHAGIATDFRFEAEVVSYSRSRGLFVGVALEGSGITMDRKANVAFYRSTSMSPEKIFASSPNIAPNIANRFVQILTAQTRRIATNAPVDPDEKSSEVRTFGIPENRD